MHHIGSMSEPIFDFSGLTVEQRLELIEQLWESIEQEPAALDPETAAELDRRLAHARAHPETLIPADEVIAQIRASLK